MNENPFKASESGLEVGTGNMKPGDYWRADLGALRQEVADRGLGSYDTEPVMIDGKNGSSWGLR